MRVDHLCISVASTMLTLSASADSITGAESDDESRPIPDAELRQITLGLIERYPELAGSAGVRSAVVPVRRDADRIVSSVLFHPHTENGGTRSAYEALCEWQGADGFWSCDHIRTVRYLQAGGRGHEVQLRGDLSTEGAIAVIERSKRQAATATIHEAGLIATSVAPFGSESYLVAFRGTEAYPAVRVMATLIPAGDPANPADWQLRSLPDPDKPDFEMLAGLCGSNPKLVALTPLYFEGRLGGYRLFPGTDAQAFSALGLETGDILIEIDGKAVPDYPTPEVTASFERMTDGETIEILVERGPEKSEKALALRLDQH